MAHRSDPALRGLWIALVFALSACHHARVFRAADRSAIEQVIRDQRDAWNRGDIEGYMAGYARTEALVFTSGGHIRRGWQATLARYQARYGQGSSSMGRLAFDIIEIRPVGPDGAIVLGRWRLTETPSAGEGVFTLVVERTDQGWRIIHDHTSVEAPPE